MDYTEGQVRMGRARDDGGGLMVSALVSSGPGSSPGRGHCIVFFGKTLDSDSASCHPGSGCKWVSANCCGNLATCGEVTCYGLASLPGLATLCYTRKLG